MQAIPPDLFQAHDDTGRQLTMIAGLPVALDDLTADNEALNTPDGSVRATRLEPGHGAG